MTQKTHSRADARELIRLDDASLVRNGHAVWEHISTSICAGEFIAVLGPNGSGKTSLLKALLGLLPLDRGTIQIDGRPPRRGNRRIGYIPQQKNFDPYVPIRGRDLVQLGVDGHQYGLTTNPKAAAHVNKIIREVGAAKYANTPIGLLSGGEQQRLRIAQALVSEPDMLLCDEPLLSLDLASQRSITKLIHDYRTRTNAAVLFVTHEINPVLPWVDRVLYLANGRWVIDTPDNVLQAKTLTNLYGTPVEVVRIKDRVLVVGAEDAAEAGVHHHQEEV